MAGQNQHLARKSHLSRSCAKHPASEATCHFLSFQPPSLLVGFVFTTEEVEPEMEDQT